MSTKQQQQQEREEEEIIFRSKLGDISIPNHLPLHSYIFEKLSVFTSRPCLINASTGETFTYADVHLASRRFASILSKLGVRRGDVVMILLQNSPEFVFTFLGVSMCGAISTTANPFYTPQEIAKQSKSSNACLIVTHACFLHKINKDLLKNNKNKNGNNIIKIVIVCNDSDDHHEHDHSSSSSSSLFEYYYFWEEVMMMKAGTADDDEFKDEDAPMVEIEAERDTVALPYSSGTTGLPKGVMLTHKNLVTSVGILVDGENPNMNFKEEDVIMCVLPLFHIYCLNSVFLCALRVGACLVIMSKFECTTFMEIIHKYKVTIIPVVPPILSAMVKTNTSIPLVDTYDLSSIRMIQSGGSPLSKQLEDDIRAMLPNAILGQGFGMTEGGPVAMSPVFFKDAVDVYKPGSCGKFVRNSEMKIVDPKTGASLPRNQSGEICIRGDQVMKGYHDDPENTAKTIDKEGWLHTGDIAYVDDDDDIFIVDRLKELIKYKGFQVAPAELEAILIAHPSISEAAVVAMKDEAAGEVPVAFIVKEIGTGDQISDEEIKNYVAQQVIFYKRIKQVFFVESIPKAPSGKLLRNELRTKLLAANS